MVSSRSLLLFMALIVNEPSLTIISITADSSVYAAVDSFIKELGGY